LPGTGGKNDSAKAILLAQKIKQDQIKLKRSEDAEKAKLKAKQEATRDLSSGSENIR